MPGSHKPVLAAIGAAVLGVSLAAGSGFMHPAAHVSLAAYVQVADPGDPSPVDPAPGDPAQSAPDPNMAKVSANTASQDVIAAALQAVGVSSPNRWAAEVLEYRPYPLNDLSLAKLRENLAKYNPAAQTVDQIVSVLLP